MKPCKICYHLPCCRFNPELPSDWAKMDENLCPYYASRLFISSLFEEHWKRMEEDDGKRNGRGSD